MAESYSKEVAQFAVVNKPYNKLFAISLSETQSSLDTSFWSAAGEKFSPHSAVRYSHSACMQLTDADFIVCDLSSLTG